MARQSTPSTQCWPGLGRASSSVKATRRTRLRSSRAPARPPRLARSMLSMCCLLYTSPSPRD
eukprot:2142938-Alexandrium_andersonii.AAC.1